MAYEDIIAEQDGGVGIITLNRPHVLNAISNNLWHEVNDALSSFEADPDVGAIIFTGAGNRAFSAGGDIHEEMRDEGERPKNVAPRGVYHWHVATCKKPTIGAINGLAYGGAAQMVASFDIRVGCENTKINFTAAALGRINSTWNLPLQVGWPMAKELLFTARVVEGEEAYRIGLLNHLVPSDQLMSKALEIGHQIAKHDSRIVQGIKELLIGNTGKSMEEMNKYASETGRDRLKGAPASEAFKSFLEKRG